MSEARLIGKYEVQAVIGKGPLGTVLRAQHAETKRTVAIKVLPPEALEPRALQPFRKYSQALAALVHPGIARFLEVVEAEGRTCLVYEFVQGTPLTALLKDGGYPEPKKAWDILRQALEALAYAHQQGAVHRDLGPSNIMVNAEGAVVITDFGNSVLYAAPSGAPEYFSPEHFGEAKLTTRSDIYQMGVLAYQLVTGKLPFTGTPEAVAHRIAEERPTDPSSYNNHLAWQLDWVVQKALSKDPADRFNAAIDFAEGLRLGLQDTVGRGLPPAQAPGAKPAAPAKPEAPKLAMAPRPVPPAAQPAAPAAAPKASVAAKPAAPAAPPKAPEAPPKAPEAPKAASTPPAPAPAAKPAAPVAAKAPEAVKPPPAPVAPKPQEAVKAPAAPKMELTLEERPAAKPAEDAKPAAAPAPTPPPAAPAPAPTPAPKPPEAAKPAAPAPAPKPPEAAKPAAPAPAPKPPEAAKPAAPAPAPTPKPPEAAKPVAAALAAKIAEAEKLAAAAAKVKAADLAAASKAPEAPKAPPAAPAPPAAKPEEAKAAAPAAAEARPVIPAALMQNAKALGGAKAAVAAQPAPEAGAGKGGILFLDDDPRILNSLRALFRSTYDVHIAESGDAAIEILKRGGIQVVVSDQRMPNMTGVDFLRQVRTLAPNAVRMLLTGYTDLASLVGSINQGEIFRFVMKPWDNDELRKSIADAFKLAAELAATEPVKPAPASRSVGSLLVIDQSEGVAKGLERLLAGAAKVIRVDSAEQAAQVLSKVEVAALVADLGVGTDALVALFREIRAKLPGVLSIVLTEEPDSDLSIELINKAQIFRLLPKPVNARDLRTQVAEALRRYSIYKQRIAAGAVKPPAQAGGAVKPPAQAAAEPAKPAAPGRASQPD